MAFPTTLAGTAVPTIIVETAVPTRLVGTDVPTSDVGTAAKEIFFLLAQMNVSFNQVVKTLVHTILTIPGL